MRGSEQSEWQRLDLSVAKVLFGIPKRSNAANYFFDNLFRAP
jgi:hypothetical protein